MQHVANRPLWAFGLWRFACRLIAPPWDLRLTQVIDSLAMFHVHEWRGEQYGTDMSILVQ